MKNTFHRCRTIFLKRLAHQKRLPSAVLRSATGLFILFPSKLGIEVAWLKVRMQELCVLQCLLSTLMQMTVNTSVHLVFSPSESIMNYAESGQFRRCGRSSSYFYLLSVIRFAVKSMKLPHFLSKPFFQNETLSMLTNADCNVVSSLFFNLLSSVFFLFIPMLFLRDGGLLSRTTNFSDICVGSHCKHNSELFQNNLNLHSPSVPSPSMSSSVYKGEKELLSVFQNLGFELPTIEHEEKKTVESANLELPRFGVPCNGTKNVFLKGKKGELVLATALDKSTINFKQIQTLTGTKELRFAPPEVLKENLAVLQGSVTPFALVNNLEKKNIIVLLDKTMMESKTPFVLHPCRNDKSTLVMPDQLKAFLNKIDYPFRVASLNRNDVPDEKSPVVEKSIPDKYPTPPPQPQAGDTQLGISITREENFSAWYIEVISKGEMIEYYDVSGCYIMRPWSYFVWKSVQRFLGSLIENMGVEDCYFPMFVSKSSLEREKDHLEGFAPEVAWVTKAGDTDLEMPIAIRPTSETIMYSHYAKWIRSHRDLPLRLNMWNNVIRWEFSHPTPFIRTREFLWQEGHCAWATEEECAREVWMMLDNYGAVYTDLMAIPVIKGMKTEKEKFAGAFYTTTVETFIEGVGRGCQGGTSHHLGQNFGKIFDIRFQDPNNTEGEPLVPWQNSWGFTTRSIGVMVMVHSDNRGLVMPPHVSSVQTIIIPVGITKDTTKEEKEQILGGSKKLEEQLKRSSIRAKVDLRDNYSPGWRFNHWELKGVPVRIEFGPKELADNVLSLALRFNGEKRKMAWDNELGSNMKDLMNEIHDSMLARAIQVRDDHLFKITDWSEFVPILNKKCIILAPWCGSEDCEDSVKKDSAEESKRLLAQDDVREDSRAPSMGAKILCIPCEQPDSAESFKCICKGCEASAKKWALFGRSY
ncbi:unnamed protein product [Phytomonas sp. Hart1]|nr:unnamed protein product [Phytomonas sp. Hart1]|eukprot:CCW69602.1 unnamed protein product [Phytomonas sp. isolate Hart1]